MQRIESFEEFQAINDRVLVRRLADPEGTIVVPDIAQTKPLRGVVISVGPGKLRGKHFQRTEVQPGDVVMFSASVDKTYPDIVQEGELVMMMEGDILGVLTVA